MIGLGRERRLNCRLYVDRQADALVIEKLDRLLIEKHFLNQTELIKHGIELVYEEIYAVEKARSNSDISQMDLLKIAAVIAERLKPELRLLLDDVAKPTVAAVGANTQADEVTEQSVDVAEKTILSGSAISFLKELNDD